MAKSERPYANNINQVLTMMMSAYKTGKLEDFLVENVWWHKRIKPDDWNIIYNISGFDVDLNTRDKTFAWRKRDEPYTQPISIDDDAFVDNLNTIMNRRNQK